MCGITVVWHREQRLTEAACRRATVAQQHRGPDADGFLTVSTARGSLAFGHRRLSILDLTPTGAQPMVDPRTQNAIVYNGEIYNFRALRTELKKSGTVFRGNSDTEVLLLGYREWGPEVFDRARGMFAAAIWDSHRHRLIVARDHIGMKPLYWSVSPDRLIIASELQAVICSGLVETNLDRSALAGLLAYGSVPEPRTMIEHVSMFPAASWVAIDLCDRPRVVDEEQYWSLPAAIDSNGTTEFRELLDNSLRGHMESDVPIGIFLSGGIDSTAVAESAARQASGLLRMFTIGFADNPSIDETAVAKATARQLGAEHQVVTVTGDEALQQAEAWMNSVDQPCLDGFNTYLISRAARATGLKVALSGLGGDELFGGYSSFRTVPRVARLGQIAEVIPASVRRWAGYHLLVHRGRTAGYKGADLAANGVDVASLVLGRRRLFSDTELNTFELDPSALALTPHYLPLQRESPQLSRSADLPAAVAAMETSFYMRDTLLRDSDISGMCHSLEIRLPLLDRDLMTAALQMPAKLRLSHRGMNKSVLVNAGGPCTAIAAQHRKTGFSLPYIEWIRGPLKELIDSGIQSVADSGQLTAVGIEQTCESFSNCRERNAPWSRVWALAVLGHWLERVEASTESVPRTSAALVN